MKAAQKFQRFLRKLGWSATIWLTAALIFVFIRVWGVESLSEFERTDPLNLQVLLFQIVVLGLYIGIPFGIMEYILDSNSIRQRSYWKVILIKSFVQILMAIFSLWVLILSGKAMSLFDSIFSETSLLWIIYAAIVSFFIYISQVVNSIIGNRVLISLLLGKYHSPTIETRIFMFLDMKDSTTHAKNLSHVKFSSLIQDCLKDLTKAIIEHKVEVYQYIGDEAVLTWRLRQGFENLNCLLVYYTFRNTLMSKKEYYENNYGFVPFFKAGVHLGEVTVSEVGAIRREIAYHSDVIDTAAHIQDKCNEFEAELLISEELKENLGDQKFFYFKRIGGITLKGKQQLMNIYKVDLL